MDEGILRIFENKKAKPPTKIFAQNIYTYDLVDSVMDIAHKKAKEGEEEGALIIAKGQRKGRGRLGRKWLSLYGKGLYFALILRPDIKHFDAPKITLLSALSIAETLNHLFHLQTSLRWPNDVLIDGKKVAGILTELNSTHAKLNFLIVGIGVNIDFKHRELPKEATSLMQESKTKIEPDKLLFTILKRLEENYYLFLKKDLLSLIPKIKALSSILGKHIKVLTPKQAIIGLAQDIDKDGALILRRDNGFLEKITSGDCILLR